MPYNGIKARRDRERLTRAIMAAKFDPQLPLDENRVTSGYGWRKHPVTGKQKFHTGVDLAAAEGEPVYATEDGYISQAQHRSSGSPRGNNVTVKHPGTGKETRYEHMSRFGKPALKGGFVKKGDVIGYTGSTGRSTGPHLHYGQFRHGKPEDPWS
jgi:murein DD-endopeptidase MepM/ murein hydrolase activator NlpD